MHTYLRLLFVEFPFDLFDLCFNSFSEYPQSRPGVTGPTHRNPQISLDQSQSLVYISFCLLLVLFYQNRSDEFVDFVFRSQLGKFLRGFSAT